MKNFGGKVVAAFVLATIAIGSASYAAGVANTQQTGYLLCFDAKTKQVTYPGKLVCPKGKKPLSLGARGLTGLTGAPGPAGLSGPSGAAGVAGASGSSGATDLFVYDSTGAKLGPLVAANIYGTDTTYTVLKDGFTLPYFPQTGSVASRGQGQYGDSTCTGSPFLFLDTPDFVSVFGAANPVPIRGLSGGAVNRTDFLVPVLPVVTLPVGATTYWSLEGAACRAQATSEPTSFYKFESNGFALDAAGPLRIGN